MTSKRQDIEWNWNTMPLSKSMVHMFEQCAFRFYLQFLQKEEFQKTPEMLEGNKLHDELEQLYKRVDRTKIHTVHDLEAEYIKYLTPVVQMQRFVELEMQRFQKLPTEVFWPRLTEEFLIDEKLWYYGTLDRFDVNSQGIGEVIDYKMGKFHKWLETKYRFELMGYKHLLMVNKKKLAEKGIDFKSIKFGTLIFLGGDEPKVWVQEIKAVTERAFYNKVPKTRIKIKQCKDNNDWPKKITPLCNWCPFAGKSCNVGGNQIGSNKV